MRYYALPVRQGRFRPGGRRKKRRGRYKAMKKAEAKAVKAKKDTKPAKAKATKAAKAVQATKAGRPAGKAVVFTLHADKGSEVCLAGEFNGWDPSAKKMKYKARAGLYEAVVRLKPGTYQYKFVIDGAWSADPANANAVANDQGTYNSVIEVR